MKKIIGIIMLIMLFGGFTSLCVASIGGTGALIVFGVVAAVITWLYIAIYLVHEE